MAQVGVFYTNSGTSDKLVMRPQDDIVRFACGIFCIIISFILLLAITTRTPSPSYYHGSGSSSALDTATIFLTLLILAPIGYLLWRIYRACRTRTTVDDSGLLLEQPGMRARSIPWRNAHGRIAVKTVTQSFPMAAAPATMSLILVALDQEEIVLPGSILSSYRPRNLTQRSYAIAMRILAYDPWGQREPLMQSENNFTPWMPRTAFYT